MKTSETISTELLAAYLEGNTTGEESRMVLSAIEMDADLREMVRMSQAIDDELDMCAIDTSFRPMTAMAASCGDENYCCLQCEMFILRKHGIPFEERSLLATALQNKWQQEKGTALFNIGRHLENQGFTISRHYQSSINDIIKAIDDGADVIAVIDGGELTADRNVEHVEDVFIGQIPDHSVVVIKCDEDRVTIYDPDSPNDEDTYPLSQFLDAWADSQNFMVTCK